MTDHGVSMGLHQRVVRLLLGCPDDDHEWVVYAKTRPHDYNPKGTVLSQCRLCGRQKREWYHA